jgi:L-threonylcarbamoyladenylate synthase
MKLFQSFENFKENYQSIPFIEEKTLIFPTETFYAIGAFATNDTAVKKIYDIKGRKENSPLLVLVSSLKMLANWAIATKEQMQVIQIIGEGVATVILPTNKLSCCLNIPQKNYSLQSVGFRITSHPLARKLMEFLQTPLVATSANFSLEKAACQIKELPISLLDKIDIAIEDGKTKGPPASSVLDFTQFPEVKLLREGLFSMENLQKLSRQYHLKIVANKKNA